MVPSVVEEEPAMTYVFKDREVGSIDGVRSESFAVGPQRWTCVSYPEHTPVTSFVTSQHATREAAVAHMAVLLATYFNAEVVNWH